MGHHTRVTRGGWSVSTTSGYDWKTDEKIDGVILNVHKHYTRPVRPEEKKSPAHVVTTKIRYGDHNGRRFPNREAATAFALDRGYLQVYSRNFWKKVRR